MQIGVNTTAGVNTIFMRDITGRTIRGGGDSSEVFDVESLWTEDV